MSDAEWIKIADSGELISDDGTKTLTGAIYFARIAVSPGEIECCSACMAYVEAGGAAADDLEVMSKIHRMHRQSDDVLKGPPAGRDRFA